MAQLSIEYEGESAVKQPLKMIFKYLFATIFLMFFLSTSYAEMYKCQGRGGVALRSLPCNADEQTVSIDGVPYSVIQKNAIAAENLQLKKLQQQDQEQRLRDNEKFLEKKNQEAASKIESEKYLQKKEYLAEGTLVCVSAFAIEEINKNNNLKNIYVEQGKCFLMPIKAKYQAVGDSIGFCQCRNILLLPTSAAAHAFNGYVRSYLIPY